MFNYNIKDQVLLLNHKTYGLENELKDLEEKIRIGQNRLHGIQRQLRREILQGEEGIPKRISDLENSLTTAFHRISILEEILDGQFDEKELSVRMNEKVISEQLDIPTIGIGAGSGTDGQILLSYDLLGVFTDFKPKFTKRYANLTEVAVNGLKKYVQEVKNGSFPDEEHSYSVSDKEYETFLSLVEKRKQI